jgi:hypothetical protein
MIPEHVSIDLGGNVSQSEPNRRYLTYLSSLALAVTPLVLPVAAAATAAAAPAVSAEASADKVAALKSAAARIADDPGYRPSAFTECYLDGFDRWVCLG